MTEEQDKKAVGVQPQCTLETQNTPFLPIIPIQVNLTLVHNLTFVYISTCL